MYRLEQVSHLYESIFYWACLKYSVVGHPSEVSEECLYLINNQNSAVIGAINASRVCKI
jgi:hypothetical protein